MIIDEPKEMEKLDIFKVLDVLEKFPEQCEDAIKIGCEFKIKIKKPKRVFICGMGGSGIVGDIVKDIFINKEIHVVKDYFLPEYANENDLVFCVSYSGDTEETLSVFKDALKKKCKTICISSGGQLEIECGKHHIDFIKIPQGLKPRFALGYLLFPIISVLEKMRFVEKQNLDLIVKNLKETREEIKPSIPSNNNPAKRIAMKLIDTIPIIQGFGVYKSIAYRAKTQFNENAKIPSFSEVYPELNHNSLLGWQDGSLGKNFSLVIIRDSSESEKIMKRIDFTKDILKKNVRNVIEVYSAFPNQLSRVFSNMYVLDFVSVYLAFLRGKDPGEDSLLSELKTILKTN
ncbi:MAG: bifunctional phosphoglucose/phosphomannose isomerase [Candidatus Aenigmatarchaeota archaeon]